MNKIIIRKERIEDYKETEHMTMRAFWNIHGPGCNEHLLVHKLRTAKEYLPDISRVAESDGKIVGTIMYSKSRVYDKDTVHDIITFGPLAVDPMAQSLGVGGMLLKETLKPAKDAGYPGICIFGEPEYYPKYGFVTCDHYGITDANGNNFDAFMAYELQENGFSGIRGNLKKQTFLKHVKMKRKLKNLQNSFLIMKS